MLKHLKALIEIQEMCESREPADSCVKCDFYIDDHSGCAIDSFPTYWNVKRLEKSSETIKEFPVKK